MLRPRKRTVCTWTVWYAKEMWWRREYNIIAGNEVQLNRHFLGALESKYIEWEAEQSVLRSKGEGNVTVHGFP